MEAITSTNFNFPNQTNLYKGKVRDVYTVENDVECVARCGRASRRSRIHRLDMHGVVISKCGVVE